MLQASSEDALLKRAHTTAKLFAFTTQAAVLITDLAALESLVGEVLTHPGIVYARVLSKQGVLGYQIAVHGRDELGQTARAFVVRKDGPTSVEELHGKKLAVPNLLALGAALMPQTYLREKGIDVTLVSVSSHDSVYRTVEKGLYPAGASNLRYFGMLDLASQAKFRVLWKTEPLPPLAYAAHPRVPLKVVERIHSALVVMDRDPEGRGLLSILKVKAIVAAKDSDYDVMRRMKLRLE